MAIYQQTYYAQYAKLRTGPHERSQITHKSSERIGRERLGVNYCDQKRVAAVAMVGEGFPLTLDELEVT